MHVRCFTRPFSGMAHKPAAIATTMFIALVIALFPYPAGAGNNAGVAFSVWPDTGQYMCYNNDAEIDCPSQGQPFYGQDAQYQGLIRSYTKLGYGGKELPDTATPADGWIMTRDNVTGLIWEVKTNYDDIENYDDPHDADNTYTRCSSSWYDEPYTEDFIAALNEQHFGGFSDWRLPTIKELSTLVDRSIPWPGPTINTYYFPNTVPANYWSSTVNASSSDGWGVSFYWGDPDIMYCVEHPYYSVRAVRGVAIHNNRFVDNHDGTITDTETGLIWQKCSMGQYYNPSTGTCEGNPQEYTWLEALSACENLTLAGYGDWRLPNINELQSIYSGLFQI